MDIKQVYSYASKAGWSANDSYDSANVTNPLNSSNHVPYSEIEIATAIAMAESNGNVSAKGGPNSDGSYDLGLWQINSKAHADILSGKNWQDPQTNADLAHTVFDNAGRSWTPWTTYNNGKYKNFLAAAAKIGDPGMGNNKLQETGSDLNPVTGLKSVGNEAKNALGGLAGNILGWVGPELKIVGVFVLALVVIIISLLLLFRKPLQQVASEVP